MAVERIKKRADFLKIAAGGRKAVSNGLVLQALAMDHSEVSPVKIRVGFTVTKRVGNAVVRNRIKRRLRAVAEQILPTHATDYTDYVIIGRLGALTRSFSELLGDLKYTLYKIEKERKTINTGNG